MNRPPHPLTVLRGLTGPQRLKGALLGSWFFVTVATLWLLKPVRTASLLASLGAAETPWVRLASVVALAAIVVVYSWAVGRVSRLAAAAGVGVAFMAVELAFWLALRLGGEAVGGSRPFVWSVYVLVDAYSTVMIGIFWTYANDIVSKSEAEKLYGPIGLGGILGGLVGGAFVDVSAELLGAVDLLLVAALLSGLSAAMAALSERMLRPHPRPAPEERGETRGLAAAFDGAREVAKSRYLVLLVGVVVAYEFAATLGDFATNIVFERAFDSRAEIAKMYGRLGWVVSVTGIVCQILLVPALLPHKRVALLVSPVVMLLATGSAILVPAVATVFLLSASDRGLNYSLQQVTKETLYVPLSDGQKYRAKAFIDMFVDRAAKALGAIAIVAIIAEAGLSVRATLLACAAMLVVWVGCASALGREYRRRIGDNGELREEASSDAPAPLPSAPRPTL